MWFIFDFVRSDLTLTVLCFFPFLFALFCWKTHTQSDEKSPSSLAFFIYFFVRGEMAPHEWKWINWLLRFSAFWPHTYTSVYIPYIRWIYVYVLWASTWGHLHANWWAAELTHVPNNWSTFWKRPVPATLVWRGIKKNVAKAKWKLWNKYTKRAIRDLWQAFMATQIFVKCLPKYLFNQSRTGYCVFEIYPRDFYI